jgi:hypothetical protein
VHSGSVGGGSVDHGGFGRSGFGCGDARRVRFGIGGAHRSAVLREHLRSPLHLLL